MLTDDLFCSLEQDRQHERLVQEPCGDARARSFPGKRTGKIHDSIKYTRYINIYKKKCFVLRPQRPLAAELVVTVWQCTSVGCAVLGVSHEMHVLTAAIRLSLFRLCSVWSTTPVCELWLVGRQCNVSWRRCHQFTHHCCLNSYIQSSHLRCSLRRWMLRPFHGCCPAPVVAGCSVVSCWLAECVCQLAFRYPSAEH